MNEQQFWTKMAAEYGINVRQGQAWLQQEFGGDYQNVGEQALEAHLRGRFMAHGGYVHPDDPQREVKPWISMQAPVARHHAMAVSQKAPTGMDEEMPEGYFQYGENIYPEEVMGYSPGYTSTDQGVLTAAKVEKFPKRWRNAFQQAPRMEFTGLSDPIEMVIRGQGVGMGEQVQRAQALVVMGSPGPEGSGYYDPSVGQAQNIAVRRTILPSSVDPEQVLAKSGMQIGLDEPTPLYEGHTGVRRPEYLESQTVLHAGVRSEDVRGEERNVLYYQTRDVYPTGAAIPIKSGPKMVGLPLRGLEETTGAQFAMPMRDPQTMAAVAVGSMTPMQQRRIFGTTVTGQLTQEQYRQYMESRDIRTHTLPPQVFQKGSDVYEALKPQLTNVQELGGNRVRAQRQVTGYLTPFGIQAQRSSRFHAQTITGEMYDVMTEGQPKLASHISDLGLRQTRTLAQIGGASLANAGVAENYPTIKAAELDWGQASDIAQAAVVEMGYEDPSEAPEGIWHRAMAQALEGQTKGRGIEFPATERMGGRLIMPSPQATRHLGGVTSMEEQTWGLYRKYGRLVTSYAEADGELTPQYRRALREAGSTLAEATQSGEFRRKQRGYVVRGMGGGRANPQEAMPANRIFMNRKLLGEALRGMAPKMGDEERAELANRIFQGKEVDPRFRMWRYPLTRPREQMNMTLEYMSFPEFKQTMERPDMTIEEAEQIGSSPVVSPRTGEAQGGDWDWDPYAMMGVTRYDQGGAEHLSGVTSASEIINRARRHPAGEHAALAEDIRNMPSPEKAAADLVAASRFVSRDALLGSFAERASAKSAVGVSTNFAMRSLRAEIAGESPAAKQAMAELGNIYMIGQDIGGMGEQAGPTTNLIRQYSRMNAATVAGVDPNTGEYFNYKTPTRWMSAMTKDVADLYKGGELGLSAQTRAVLMGGADNPNLGGITSLMEQYQAAEGDPMAQAKMLTRMRQLTVGKGPDEPVSLKEFTEASPTAGLIWSMAERRDADRRGTTKETEYGVRGYAEAQDWQVELGKRGEAIQGMAMARYRHGDYAREPFSKAAQQMATAVESKVLEPAATRRLRSRLAMMGYTGPVAEAAAEQPDTIPTSSAETEAMPQRTAATGGPSVAADTPMGQAYNIIGGIIGGDPVGPDAPQMHRAAVKRARDVHDQGEITAYRKGFNEFLQKSGLEVSEAQKVWGQALQRTGGPSFSARSPSEGVGHQYRQFLRSQAGGEPTTSEAPSTGGAGAPPAGGGPPPGTFDPSQVAGGAVAGGGGGADRASTLLGGALERAAKGSEQGFGLKITGGYTPGQGFNFSGGMFDTSPDAQLATKMHETIKIFEQKVNPALEQLGDTSGTLSKQQIKVAKQLGTMYESMERGMKQIQAMPEEDRPAGMVDQLSAAQNQLLNAGVPQLAARAQTQGQYGAIIGAAGMGGGGLQWQGTAGGGSWGQFGGRMARTATNYFTWMRLRRMWNMMGAPSFQNQQFAAQQQMSAYGAAQSLGFEGTVPGGVAGGLMQRRAQQAQAQAAYGMAGYRTWGAGAGTMGATARGIYGPAAAGAAIGGFGAAGIYGALSNAGLVAGGSAVGVGLTAAGAIAAPAAAYATGRYLGSFAKPSAENMVKLGPDASPWEIIRASAGTAFKSPLKTMLGQPDAAGIVQGVRNLFQMSDQAHQEYNAPLPELSVPSRAAWLKRAAGNWAGREGTVWQGADSNQFMQTFNQAAGWQPWIGQMGYEQLNRQPPMMMERIQALGYGPERYAQAVQRAGGGIGDVGSFYMGVTGPGTTQWSRQQAMSSLGQWGSLFGKWGADSDQLLRGARQGWLPAMSGDQLYNFQRLAGGSRKAWARQAGRGSFMGVGLDEVGLSAVEAETGMGLYTTRGLNEAGPFYEPLDRIRDGASMIGGWGGMWGLQDTQRSMQRSYARQRYQEQQGWLSQQYSYYAADVHPMQRSITQQQRQISGLQWQYTQAGWGRQAEQEALNFGQGLESIALSRQIYMTRRGYGQDDMDRRREDENRRYQRLLVQRGWQQQDWQWGQEDIETGWTRQQAQQQWQREDWTYQGVSRSAAYSQSMTQFGWQREDINRNRSSMLREFGWNIEDYSRNIRFASGRQREQLERQRERATIRFAERYSQAGTQEERLDQREQWYTQQFEREEEHFERQRQRQEEQWDWAEEDYQKQVERHQEALERMEEKWRWQDEDHERALERIDEREDREGELHDLRLKQFDMRERHLREDHEMRLEHWEEEHEEATKLHNLREQLRDDQEKLAELQREHQLESIERQQELNEIAEDYRQQVNALREEMLDLQRRQQAQVAAFEDSVKRAFSDIVDHLEYEARSAMPPWAP